MRTQSAGTKGHQGHPIPVTFTCNLSHAKVWESGCPACPSCPCLHRRGARLNQARNWLFRWDPSKCPVLLTRPRSERVSPRGAKHSPAYGKTPHSSIVGKAPNSRLFAGKSGVLFSSQYRVTGLPRPGVRTSNFDTHGPSSRCVRINAALFTPFRFQKAQAWAQTTLSWAKLCQVSPREEFGSQLNSERAFAGTLLSAADRRSYARATDQPGSGVDRRSHTRGGQR